MKRIITSAELNSGQHATIVVTKSHILVRIDERACLAHRRWFDRTEAAELAHTLAVFASGEAS